MTAATLFDKLMAEFADMDKDIANYIKSYLKDTPPDEFGEKGEALLDFLGPLIIPEDDFTEPDRKARGVLEELCVDFTARNSLGPSDSATTLTKLSAPVTMDSIQMSNTAEFVLPQRSTDISLSSTKQRFLAKSSLIDQKKLDKAEAKLLKKQEERLARDLVDPTFEIVDMKSDANDFNRESMSIDPTASNGRTRDIKVENFDISFGGKRILTGATLNLVYGRVYGLIGRNGIGKSTLLRAISRRDIRGVNKNGTIPEWLRILQVAQEVAGDDVSVIDTVMNADVFLISLLEEERALQTQLTQLENNLAQIDSDETAAKRESIGQQLKAVYEKLQEIEADKAQSKAGAILSGLGFSSVEQTLPTKSFSGGWRMRIALARALFCRPDLLLLDEPTNHLDINALIWLEKYVQQWPNTLVIVSHDRDFLDSVSTDIIHMHNYRLDQYRGNYSNFLATRNERRKNQLKEYESQLMYRQHLQSFIDKWRYNAKRAAQAQSKIKILEKLPPLEPLEDDGVEDGQLSFRWPDPVDKLSPPILQADNVSFAYKTKSDSGEQVIKPVLNNVSFSVGLDTRAAIVGVNGSGKTTLLKLLIGQLEPTKGIVSRHSRLRIAYFSQHHMEALEPSNKTLVVSPLSLMASRYPGENEEEYRRILGRFGITGQTALQPMQTLSGGQKSRVVFAMMAMNNPHILVLDEVTNHLDIMTIDSLINALNPETGFKGGVLIVSHDTRFIDKVCRELWVCENGTLNKHMFSDANLVLGAQNTLEGSSGITDYKQKILDSLKQ